jgi:hypothetical protein
LPSKATQNGYLSDELRHTLLKVTVSDRQERHRDTSQPDGKLLQDLSDACVKHFDGDEEQARCALRRHLVLRYQWTDETITRQLSEAEVLHSVSAVS